MDTSQRIKVRIERLVAKGSSVLATQRRPSSPNVTYPTSVNTGAFAEWRTQSLSLLTNILGAEHVYVASFEQDVKGTHTGSVEAGIGILKAVGEDLEDGYLTDDGRSSRPKCSRISSTWSNTCLSTATRIPQLRFAGRCSNRDSGESPPTGVSGYGSEMISVR